MPLQIVTHAVEPRLMKMLGDVRGEPIGWQAVHFHLNELLEEYRSEYQMKIALNLINDLLKNYKGAVFLFGDSSILVLCYELEKNIIEKLVFQMRYLFMDDPLAYDESGKENAAFCSAYDIKRQGKEFYALCSQHIKMAVRHSINPEKEAAAAPAPIAPSENMERSEKQVFSASRLAIVEHDLLHADLHRLIQRQPICAVLPGMPARRVFDELYIHIAHLKQMLKTNVDFFSNRWLFKYLTRILDERMIALIRRQPSRYLDTPVSFNFNVETLLSQHFADFDAVIKPSAKVSIVFEIPVEDVFTDMAAFITARDEVQKLGYRVCLDGLTAASFPAINREKLGIDLLKVQWNPDTTHGRGHTDMATAVRAAGANRVILCRCDSQTAVEYGQSLGISLFQGRHLDSLVGAGEMFKPPVEG